MKKIYAYQITEGIDIKQFRKQYAGAEYFANNSEVFYCGDNERYLYVFSYGVVVFSGYDETQMSESIEFLRPFCKILLPERNSEVFVINDEASKDKFGFNEAYLSKFNPDVMRIVMLNVGQSAALDYFSQQASGLLETTKAYTNELQKSGNLKISSKKLMKFIGKTLNVKNNIIENIYIIDSPDETWEDEYLTKLDSGLKNTFDIKDRFRDIEYHLQIVKENLDLFIDMSNHRRSNNLEIIVIVLILFEVIQALIESLTLH